MSSIIWSEEDQKFIKIPDGDEATLKEIKDYYESRRYTNE